MVFSYPFGFWNQFYFKTGVILANLKEAGKIEEQIALLNWQYTCSGNNSTFSFKIFTGMSESGTALLISKFSITFITIFVDLGKIENS